MTITIILLIVVAILAFLLFTPIVLFVDTTSNEYFIQAKGIFKATAEPDENEFLKIRCQLFFYSFYIYPLRKRKKNTGKKSAAKKKKKNKFRFNARKIGEVVRSFKLKRLELQLDTGDYVLNAKLVPVFVFLNYKLGSFAINFNGKSHFALELENRPIRIIKSFIHY
ncbi:MAG: hypothetical protein HKN48_08605 [Flavobacteriaceae bacterium]|nr:hypothetical protein [Flavobacteriaceae bacterium]